MKKCREELAAMTANQRAQYIRVQAELNTMRLQRNVAHSLLAVFALNTLCALSMIFLVGTGKMNLSESLITTVLAGTVAQAAPIFFIVTKSLFPKLSREGSSAFRSRTGPKTDILGNRNPTSNSDS